MITFQHTRFLTVAAGILTFATSTASADWRQFRGNNIDGVATDSSAPTALDEKSQAWKVDLPGRGLSGPIVIGKQVVLTASSGPRQDKLHVLSFDATTGEMQWERRFWATGRTLTHEKMCNATPTPASDGERIFASFSSNDVVCLDLAGNLLWYRGLTFDYPNASNSLGMSSSPVVADGVLICQVESDAEAFAVGLDANTGEEAWRIERPRKANWTSPALLKTPAGTLALLQSSAGLSAVSCKTGKEVWAYSDGASTIPSSVVAANMVYIPSNGITAIKPNTESSSPEILWQESQLAPSTPSPLVLGNQIFVVNRSGALACGDLKTGKRLWQLRLKGPFSATPVAADGRLYFFGEKGDAQIVTPGEKKGEITATEKFDATFLASPAISDGAIFVRSDEHLWKISSKN